MICICQSCESCHFNVCWCVMTSNWQIACEGCGTIYDLTPTGFMQLFIKGDQITKEKPLEPWKKS